MTVGTAYALSALSAIFPKSLAENIAFMFTNVASPLSCNFSKETIPEALKDARLFFLDNPIALQKKYLGFKDNLGKQKVMESMPGAVLAGEERALDTLVNLFDWLDGLGPQPTREIVYLYNLSQTIAATITNTLAQMDQAAAKKVEIDKLMAALKNNSYVSSSPWGSTLCLWDKGYECYLQPQEHSHHARLEDATLTHQQYDMRPDELLF